MKFSKRNASETYEYFKELIISNGRVDSDLSVIVCFMMKQNIWEMATQSSFLAHLIRHSPDDIQIRGNGTSVPPLTEQHPFRSHPAARFWRSALVRKAI